MEIVLSCYDRGTRESILERIFLKWVDCELLSSALLALGIKTG